VLCNKRSSPSAGSDSTPSDHHTASASISPVSVLNTHLLLNTVGPVCKPSNFVVPETLPQDFVEVDDSCEVQNQSVGKEDDCSVTCEQVDCPVAEVQRTSHMPPSTSVRSPEKTSSGSPVFSRQCGVPVPVSSSPSLFDDEEEKRLHQRNVNKNLLLTSEKKFAVVSHICADVSQLSPSVLSGNKLNMNNVHVDHLQPLMVTSQLRSSANERDGSETVNEEKCKDGCDVKMKLSDMRSSSEMLPNKFDTRMNCVDDKLCCTQTTDVNRMPATDSQLACDIDLLELSGTGSNVEQNDKLEAVVKLPHHKVASDTCSASHVTYESSDFQQPLPKKRRCETVNSSIVLCGLPHAVNVDDNVVDRGKLLNASVILASRQRRWQGFVFAQLCHCDDVCYNCSITGQLQSSCHRATVRIDGTDSAIMPFN